MAQVISFNLKTNPIKVAVTNERKLDARKYINLEVKNKSEHDAKCNSLNLRDMNCNFE